VNPLLDLRVSPHLPPRTPTRYTLCITNSASVCVRCDSLPTASHSVTPASPIRTVRREDILDERSFLVIFF
jgi:hypothetical protein